MLQDKLDLIRGVVTMGIEVLSVNIEANLKVSNNFLSLPYGIA